MKTEIRKQAKSSRKQKYINKQEIHENRNI